MATSSLLQSVDIYKTKIDKITVNLLSNVKSKHSYCWNYFGQLVVNIDGKKRLVLSDQVFCDACLRNAKEKDRNLLFNASNVKAYSKNIATSNLLRHLKNDHKLEEKETRQKPKAAPKENFFSIERRTVKKTDDSAYRKDKSQLARDLALWFARSLIPFDSVDDEPMKDFLKKYEVIFTDADLPSRQNIAREGLEDVYESMLIHIKTIINKQICKFGAITTDLWTDQYRRRNYITCTYHFITEEMELKKFTLATKQVTAKHTCETIKGEIQEILQDFEIEQSRIVLVTDADSNMKRAADLLNMESYLCIGHALHNLVTVDGIQATEEISVLIAKCKKIIKHLRYRAPQLEAAASKEHRELLLTVEEIGEQLEISYDANPISECSDSLELQNTDTYTISVPPTIKTSTPTRWHSMLAMLSSLNHKANRRPINEMLRDAGYNSYQLKDYEHNLIADLIIFLEKIKQVVEILCSETQPTINLALIFKSELKRLLEECDDNNPLVLTKLKHSMLNKLEHRFPSNDIVLAASLLDCRFHSIKEIDQFMETRGTTKVSFLTSMVEKKIHNLKVMVKEQSNTASTSTAGPGPISAASTSFLADLARRHGSQQNTDSIVENECWKYFSTASSEDLNPYNGNVLLYWKDRRTSFPFLSALARAILFIPATSTSSERVFSVAGQVITAKRSRLNPLRINRIIFIHDNYNPCKDTFS